MKFRYDTYCGLYCGACPVILAIEENRLEEFAEKTKPQSNLRAIFQTLDLSQ